MTEVFIKYHWQEESITFYVHYTDGWAVRQLEISARGKVYLTEEHPAAGDSELSDQPLSKSDFSEGHFISRDDFERAWKEA
ncbi:MAG: hypothetical protein EOP49_15550 [Sphingobacteriales bacterium]|nr:MAG: hypothetical protein EOP49_15550 [Sphingobacteriales bacterium]